MFSTPEHLAHAALPLRGIRSRRVSTSVGRVHVLDAPGRGALPPMVMLHGFSSAALHFAPLIERIRPHVTRVLAPDMPAHGYSDAPHTGVDPDSLRRGLFDALDAVIDQPVVLFGNSMGGLAAVRYALARPSRVRGLVLISPGGAAMEPVALAGLVRSLTMHTHGEALDFVDRMLVRPASPWLRPMLAWGVRRKFDHPHMRALLARLSPADLLSAQDLAQLAVPTLVVWGRGDRVLPTACREFFRAHLPAHARFEEPYGFSHNPYLEEPDAVAHTLLRFAREANAQAHAATHGAATHGTTATATTHAGTKKPGLARETGLSLPTLA